LSHFRTLKKSVARTFSGKSHNKTPFSITWRSQCKDCGGGSICEHGRVRSNCKDCGGGSICEHGRQRSQCKDCGGGSICEHGRVRSRCKDCGGGGPVIFLEATEVEEFDGEEDPDEWVPTVQALAIGRPRGGKRKRWLA